MPGVVGRVKRTPKFDARGVGLLHFVRNDGRRGGLDCHASLAMTGRGGVDCFALLVMTGGGGSGESKTLKKFEKNCFISLWEYT